MSPSNQKYRQLYRNNFINLHPVTDMLTRLIIHNYAIIPKLELSIQPGLSIITGETGAGKSILLGALGLALGKRADTKVLPDENSKCVVEAHFKLMDDSLAEYFAT